MVIRGLLSHCRLLVDESRAFLCFDYFVADISPRELLGDVPLLLLTSNPVHSKPHVMFYSTSLVHLSKMVTPGLEFDRFFIFYFLIIQYFI